MLIYRLLLIMFLAIAACANISQANQRFPITSTTHTIEYFAQGEREHFIDYVLKLDDSTWQKAEQQLDFGLISRSYWIRFNLDTPLPSNSEHQWY